MRIISVILSALCLLASVLCLPAAAASVQFGRDMQRFMPSPLGDARLASSFATNATNTMYDVRIPNGEHSALTICGWLRASCPGIGKQILLTTAAQWCPDPIRRSNPDLLGGQGGFPTNTVLSGTLTVSPFPWQPYAGGSTESNYWPRGVYTVAGWSSNVVAVALGGAQAVMFGPGPFNCNIVPGSGSGLTVTGSGLACIGISRTPAHQFFGAIDGVLGGGDLLLTPDSIVTNELVFVSYRMEFSGLHQLYRSDLSRIGVCGSLGQVKTNDIPASGRTSYSSRGLYKIGLSGLGGGSRVVEVDGFGFRCLPRWISDEEMCRIKANDETEIARRGIPRWR
jgi:hypothetical protein